MIFNWKGDGVLTVTPLDVEKFKELEKIEDANTRSLRAGDMFVGVKQLVILPGWNEIEDAKWFLCRPHLISKIDAGMIEEMIREERDEEGNKKYVGIKTTDFKNRQGAVYSPEKLVEIIKGCFSVETLERWRKEEAREEIRFELMNQIEKMNKPPE